jgi:hypothetical protein
MLLDVETVDCQKGDVVSVQVLDWSFLDGEQADLRWS